MRSVSRCFPQEEGTASPDRRTCPQWSSSPIRCRARNLDRPGWALQVGDDLAFQITEGPCQGDGASERQVAEMPNTDWENLQPFVEDDEEQAEPFELDRLTALYASLQSALVAARELGWQVAVSKRDLPGADSTSPP